MKVMAVYRPPRPDVHIAITGIEKVVEKLADIPALLTLLTRSATGQTITTYVNMI